MPVGVVETEELGALELEAGDAPAARLEGSPDLVERARPHRNDDRGDGVGADAPRPAPVGEQPVHVPDDLDVDAGPVRARSGRGRDRGDEPAARRELQGAHLEQALPLARRGHAPGAALGLVDVVRVAREDRAARGQAGRVGDPVHGRPGDRDVHRARRQAGRLLEGDARHADHRGGRRVVLERSAAGIAVGLCRGVMGARARIGGPEGVARRRDRRPRARPRRQRRRAARGRRPPPTRWSGDRRARRSGAGRRAPWRDRGSGRRS